MKRRMFCPADGELDHQSAAPQQGQGRFLKDFQGYDFSLRPMHHLQVVANSRTPTGIEITKGTRELALRRLPSMIWLNLQNSAPPYEVGDYHPVKRAALHPRSWRELVK